MHLDPESSCRSPWPTFAELWRCLGSRASSGTAGTHAEWIPLRYGHSAVATQALQSVYVFQRAYQVESDCPEASEIHLKSFKSSAESA